VKLTTASASAHPAGANSDDHTHSILKSVSIAPGPLGALHLEVQQLVRGDQAFMLGREIAALHGMPD
jgi:hypothetical protein